MVDSKSKITLESLPVQDLIGFSQDLNHMKLISGEKLLFADKVKKINMFDWSQERILVVTNHAVYNIYKKAVKRCILVRDIGGISKTVPPSKA